MQPEAISLAAQTKNQSRRKPKVILPIVVEPGDQVIGLGQTNAPAVPHVPVNPSAQGAGESGICNAQTCTKNGGAHSCPIGAEQNVRVGCEFWGSVGNGWAKQKTICTRINA